MLQADRLRERERLEAALDTYGRASDLKPDRVEPMAGRALVLLDMGQKLQAEAAFQQALKVNPRYAVAVMGLAETYRMLGKKEQAIQQYERYLELLPDGPEAGVARSALTRLRQ
jgi:tetratricopeptide (TPR) repeat protein